MPLQIEQILTNDEKTKQDLRIDLYDLIATKIGEDYLLGFHADEEKGLVQLALDFRDEFTGDSVLKGMYTITTSKEKLEVVDIDVIVNNENEINLNFLYKYCDFTKVCEGWTVEYDGGRGIVEVINRLLVDGNLKGKHRVSLSALPFCSDEQLVIAKDMTELNEKFGIKPQKLAWLGEDETLIGIGETFIYNRQFVGKILSKRKIRTTITNHKYEAIIVQLETIFGIVPALFPISYKDKLIDGYFALVEAEIKADLSVGDKNYYPELLDDGIDLNNIDNCSSDNW